MVNLPNLLLTKERPTIVAEIKYRTIKENRNFMAIAVGGCGSGKTYSMLKLATALDPTFFPTEDPNSTLPRVVFTAADFMKLLVDGDANGPLPPGSVILWDECSVNLNARDWQSTQNKLIAKVGQTFRHRRLICLFTCPAWSLIDSQFRMLFDMYFETMEIKRKEKMTILRPCYLSYDPKVGKMYYLYFRRRSHDGKRLNRVSSMAVGLPSLALRKAYEKKKSSFTYELNTGVKKGYDTGTNKDGNITKKPLSLQEVPVYERLLAGIEPKRIAEEMGLTDQKIYGMRKKIIEKGYQI